MFEFERIRPGSVPDRWFRTRPWVPYPTVPGVPYPSDLVADAGGLDAEHVGVHLVEAFAQAQAQHLNRVAYLRLMSVRFDDQAQQRLPLLGGRAGFQNLGDDGEEAAAQPASDEVESLTAGSQSRASQGVLAASAPGNTLGAQAEKGEISNDDYAQKSTEERQRQQRATQAQRRSG